MNAKSIWNIREIGILIATIVLGAFFTALNPLFFSLANIFTLLRMTAMLGLVTIPMALLLISGEFGLSVGSIYALAPSFFVIKYDTKRSYSNRRGILVDRITVLYKGRSVAESLPKEKTSIEDIENLIAKRTLT